MGNRFSQSVEPEQETSAEPEEFDHIILADFKPQQKGDLNVKEDEKVKYCSDNDNRLIWCKVELENGLYGWVPSRLVAKEGSLETMD